MVTVKSSLVMAAMTLLCWTLLGGCAKQYGESSVIELVPDDAVVVKCVDVDRLLARAGCGRVFDNGGNLLENTEKIMSLVVQPDYRDALAAVMRAGKGTDLSRLAVFTAAQGYEVALMPVVSRNLLESAVDVASGGKCEYSDGYAYAEIGNATVAIGDGHCWIVPDIAAMKETVGRAAHNHFGTLAGVRQFLEGDGMARVAVNCGNSMLSFLGGADRWMCVTLDASEASVSASASVMNRDGKLEPLGNNFTEIDTDFLRYTPEDAVVVLAFGKFSGNVRALGFLLGRFAPVYLARADGTTSLYAVAASGNADAVRAHDQGAWNVETMVHVPEDFLDEGIGQYVESSGGTAHNIGDQWTYREGDGQYYFGAFDGCLVFSTNREISGNFNNSFTEDFLGKRAAMVINVPVDGVIARAWGLPYGLTMKMAVDSTRWHGRITFNGSGMSAFESLLALPQLDDYHARFESAIGR